MCHCDTPLEEMTTTERRRLLAEHSPAELREEFSTADLETLGLTA